MGDRFQPERVQFAVAVVVCSMGDISRSKSLCYVSLVQVLDMAHEGLHF